jgi:formylglycine-generating enzyme required for sulfatase activity/serine/threonine protein kinase
MISGIPTIPDHELIRSIGRGGYGEIWLAQTITGAWRAVKIVFPEPEASYREFDGIRSFEPISRHHAGFVNIYHVGQGDGFFYYTMELADDCSASPKFDPQTYRPRTLSSDMRENARNSVAETIKLGKRLAEALAYLHSQGLTHRDIKPSNVIFVRGEPKLADIGLVALAGRRTYVGTEGYVPKEGPGSPQADLYALGKVLYEFATGKDRLDFPEIPTALPDFPDKEELLELNKVLLKACAKEPRQRHRSGTELSNELQAIGGPERKRRSPLWLFGLFFVIAVAVAAVLILHHPPSRPATNLVSPVPSPLSTPSPSATAIPPSHVRIVTEPPGAQVFEGDKLLGTTPFTLEGVVGKVLYELRLPRFLFATVTGEISPGQESVLSTELKPASIAAPGKGWENTLGQRFVPVGYLLFSIWDTRVKDFAEFIRATNHSMSGQIHQTVEDFAGDQNHTWDSPGFPQSPEHPVVGVSWKDAMAFCEWLTQKERAIGLLQENQFYRLPTDLEWSAAVGLEEEEGATPEERSGKSPEKFPWGRGWPPPWDAGNYAGGEMRGSNWPAAWKVISNYSDNFARTAPVGSFSPNRLGIYDLGGNVWQWCMDKYSLHGETRVLRGASWANVEQRLLQSSCRTDDIVDSRTDCYGFRIVLQSPVIGSLDVDSKPGGAEIFLNAKPIGKTPFLINDLIPGTARIELRLPGFRTRSVEATVQAYQQTHLELSLDAVSMPSANAEWTNSLGMKFAPVKGGLFSIWLTRVSDYQAYCRSTDRGMPAPDFTQGPDHPIVLVNRDDGQSFCDWLTTKEQADGLLASNQRYRLPTDAEWSRAAGLEDEKGQTPAARDSKDAKHYPWGKSWPPPAKAGNFGENLESKRTGKSRKQFPQTSPVGTFPANLLGLYDMSGNVWEWCADAYGSPGTFANWGVLRGGSWATYSARQLLISYRDVVAPGDRDVIYGFRCLLDLGE